MKAVKPLTLGLLTRPSMHRGRHRLTIAALGFFRLGERLPRFLPEATSWPLVIAELPALAPLDEVCEKPFGEVLLAGRAHAPGGQPVPELVVRMQLGPVDKRLRVLGDRRWYYGPWYRLTDPARFVAMPLVDSRAYGGPRHPDNPAGTGYTGNPVAGWVGQNEGDMPNIESVDEPVQTHVRRLAPAGFGPVDLSRPARTRFAGRYDERWLLDDAPGLPRDLDPRMFQVARADQWATGPFVGDEPYRLENLHPTQPVLQGQLPGFRARAFVRDKADEAIREVTMQLDTIWLLPGAGLGVAIYHGGAEVRDPDARDVATVLIGYEALTVPREAAHYHEVMRLRTDPATAALYILSEAQLAPDLPEATRAANEAAASARRAALLVTQQAALDETMEEFWVRSQLKPPADYVPPRAELSPLSLDAESVATGEVDLGKWVTEVSAVCKKAQEDGEKRLAAARAELAKLPPPPPPDEEQERAQIHKRASEPASDLVGGVDPRSADLDRVIAQAARTGTSVDPEKLAQARDGLARLPSLQRQARRMALQPSAEALTPALAAWLGELVRGWRRDGVPLAGRDLRGAALSGCSFAGADLREVCFESAELHGADFSAADLRGASFVGANLKGTSFRGARLDEAGLSACKAEGADFRDASLNRAMAMEADFRRACFDGAVLDDAVLGKARLDGASLARARLVRTLLVGAVAPDSSWSAAELSGCPLLNAELSRADFRGARLARTVLLAARLDDSRWDGAKISHGIFMQATARRMSAIGLRATATNFRGVDGKQSCFRRAVLVECDFGEADLTGAILEDALLASCILQGTRLTGCEAAAANFLRSVCRQADFGSANLQEANFRQAALQDAKFTEARLGSAVFDHATARRMAHRKWQSA